MILNENASRQGTHLLIATGAPIELTRTQRKRDWNQPDSLELQQQKQQQGNYLATTRLLKKIGTNERGFVYVSDTKK